MRSMNTKSVLVHFTTYNTFFSKFFNNKSGNTEYYKFWTSNDDTPYIKYQLV